MKTKGIENTGRAAWRICRVAKRRAADRNQSCQSINNEGKMHCSNCGSYLPPGVRFCSGCGTAAADPEATQIVRAPRETSVPERFAHDYKDDEPEQVIFTVRPTLIFIKLGYLLAAIAAIGLVVLLALIPVVPAFISIPVALLLFADSRLLPPADEIWSVTL